MKSAPPKLTVLVVGAGLSGLSAAISCALSGHNVTVVESAKELAEVVLTYLYESPEKRSRQIGAGLQITPNASRLFKSWGISEKIQSFAAEPTSLTVRRYSDGHILAREDDYDKKVRRKYNAPFIDLHRVDLQQTLAARARELGVRLLLGARVTSVDFSSTTPTLTTDSGRTLSGDLVVGADGLWSKCRTAFLGRELPPLPTGDLAYRIVLKAEQITDPKLREWIQQPAVRFWIGPRSHVVAYSLRAGREFNIVLLVPDDLPENVARKPGNVDEMRELFRDWDPILSQFLGYVDNVDKWKLMHLSPLDSWVNNQSNFVMIGDACHPMLPYLAQGANSSMEDGAVLGKLLGHLGPGLQLPGALELYQQLRKARGEAIVRETFKQRDSFHMVDGPGQEARDALFMSYLDKEIDCEFPSRWTCPKVQPWIFGYDAEKEVAAAIAKLGLNARTDSLL